MLARASSCVGDSWCHAMFKVKYCHKIFESEEVRFFVSDLFYKIAAEYDMPIKKIGIDADHVHLYINIKLRSKPEAAKILKGITGRNILKRFPAIKNQLFWGSGFWNPSYLMDNVGRDEQIVENYVGSQHYSC